MNFCGADQRFVYDDFTTRGMSTPSHNPAFGCGVCTKADSTDEDFAIPSRSSDQKQPMKTALDNIQQTLEETVDNDAERMVLDCFVPQTPPRRTQGKGHQRTSSLFSMSPSPTLLNPLASAWSAEGATEEGVELCPMPTLSSNSAQQVVPSGLEVLLRRLEEGFNVRLISGPSSCLSVGEMHSICSHWDRSCLYLKTSLQPRTAARDDQNNKAELDCWIELPVDRIAKIECGGGRRRSFTLVVDKHGDAVFYDFEASSSVDREIIVTTIMLLLEGGIDGTLDQPIPCSPSLDQHLSATRSYESHVLLPKPSRDTWETCIQIEGMGIAEQTRDLDHDPEELRLDFKPSASSVNLAAVNSTQMTWCPADTCTLALNDIADTCTGIFAMKQSENVIPQQDAIEEFIATALGAPSAVYNYLAMPEVWANQQHSGNNGSSIERSAAQNRAGMLNAQAARLRNLRNEMTFAAALRQSKERTHFVQTAHSFDMPRNDKSNIDISAKAADVLHTSPLLHSIVGNMNTANEDRQDEACYYDSDPEDYRTRTEKPRRAAVEGFESSGTGVREKGALRSIDFDSIGSHNRISRKVDEETISDIVHAITNERLTLMWHPTQNAKKRNRSPICVKVWIESGVYLNDGTFLLPKLNWSKVTTHPELLKKLDLLDICRIRHVSQVDRLQHPFALTRRSFYIETQTEVYVFQAQTTEERDRIVYCLKLVVARLASLLMLRDVRAAEEFFGAVSNQVPGEAPCWTQKRENEEEESTADHHSHA